jgi:hypothetical protein
MVSSASIAARRFAAMAYALPPPLFFFEFFFLAILITPKYQYQNPFSLSDHILNSNFFFFGTLTKLLK